MARDVASVYADNGRDLLGTVELDIKCGQAFCDTCGDCLMCYGDDPCSVGNGGDHYFVIYEGDLRGWFGHWRTVPIAVTESHIKRCGSNPPPTTRKPDFHPPGQSPRREH